MRSSESETPDAGWSIDAGSRPGEIVVAGEIDFSVTPTARERLWAVLDREKSREIVLEMADLRYIDSSALALLIEMRKLLAEAGKTVRIRSISPQVRKLFDLTQLGELFGLPD